MLQTALTDMATLSGGIVIALLVVGLLALHVTAIVWVGRDARRRQIKQAWALQVVTALQFPWVALMYFLVTRMQDERDASAPPTS